MLREHTEILPAAQFLFIVSIQWSMPIAIRTFNVYKMLFFINRNLIKPECLLFMVICLHVPAFNP